MRHNPGESDGPGERKHSSDKLDLIASRINRTDMTRLDLSLRSVAPKAVDSDIGRTRSQSD